MRGISIDDSSPRALYQQIEALIRANIEKGAWQPGERIPSENLLVEELGVSRMTVNRALRNLTDRGLLHRVAGVGTFVADKPRHTSLIELRDIAAEIRSSGETYACEVAIRRSVKADARTAERMGIAPKTSVFHVVLVHRRAGLAVAEENRFVNPTLAPDFLEADFETLTPTQYLLDRIQLDELEHVVQAVNAPPSTRRRLDIGESEPCLRLERRTWHRGEVVTWVSFVYPGSRYGLQGRYHAEQFNKSPSSA